MSFDWDEQKAKANLGKHGVAFEEERSVFDNPLALIFDDERHSREEHREIIIGHSLKNRIVLVSFVERAGAVRIISARCATAKESHDYEEGGGF